MSDPNDRHVIPEMADLRLDPEIYSLDLEPISFKACMDEGWSIQQVDRIELDYRIYLQAIKANPEIPFAPSRDIDRYWHHHILDTQKYIEDCHKIFGYYLHHFPYSGLLGDEDLQEQKLRYQLSQSLMRQQLQQSKESLK